VSAFRRTTAPAPASLAANPDNPRRNCGPPVRTLPLPRRSTGYPVGICHTWSAFRVFRTLRIAVLVIGAMRTCGPQLMRWCLPRI